MQKAQAHPSWNFGFNDARSYHS